VKPRVLDPEVASIFRAYEWRGNVRELRNVIERVTILEDGEKVTTEFLPSELKRQKIKAEAGAAGSGDSFVLPEEGIALETVEMELAKQAVERTGGNLTKAAKLLSISRDQLRYRLKKSGENLVEET
jgi:DNA-binding NtrC family response regulator